MAQLKQTNHTFEVRLFHSLDLGPSLHIGAELLTVKEGNSGLF